METNSNKSEEELKVEKKWENMKLNGYKSHLIVKNSPGKGLGVFANRNFEIGEDIEYCHSAPLAFKQRYTHDPGILKYAYWTTTCKCEDCKRHGPNGFMLFGNGSIYNSADSAESANAIFFIYPKNSLVVFKSTKKIKKDEEILVWWGQKYYDGWCLNKNNQ
jgi:hypothetical protein